MKVLNFRGNEKQMTEEILLFGTAASLQNSCLESGDDNDSVKSIPRQLVPKPHLLDDDSGLRGLVQASDHVKRSNNIDVPISSTPELQVDDGLITITFAEDSDAERPAIKDQAVPINHVPIRQQKMEEHDNDSSDDASGMLDDILMSLDVMRGHISLARSFVAQSSLSPRIVWRDLTAELSAGLALLARRTRLLYSLSTHAARREQLRLFRREASALAHELLELKQHEQKEQEARKQQEESQHRQERRMQPELEQIKLNQQKQTRQQQLKRPDPNHRPSDVEGAARAGRAAGPAAARAA